MVVPPTELRRGDIVVIDGSPLMVHRVVKVLNQHHVLTKGDISLTIDSPTDMHNLAGKVIAVIRKENKPVIIKGRLWQMGNYMMAMYSLTCFLVWQLVSKNRWFVWACRRLSTVLRQLHMCLPRVMARLAHIQRR